MTIGVSHKGYSLDFAILDKRLRRVEADILRSLNDRIAKGDQEVLNRNTSQSSFSSKKAERKQTKMVKKNTFRPNLATKPKMSANQISLAVPDPIPEGGYFTTRDNRHATEGNHEDSNVISYTRNTPSEDTQ